MAEFKFNQSALDKIAAQVVANTQAGADTAVQDAVRRVRDRHGGEPADRVYAQLVDEINTSLHNIGLSDMKPNEETLRRFAGAIVDGTLDG